MALVKSGTAQIALAQSMENIFLYSALQMPVPNITTTRAFIPL